MHHKKQTEDDRLSYHPKAELVWPSRSISKTAVGGAHRNIPLKARGVKSGAVMQPTATMPNEFTHRQHRCTFKWMIPDILMSGEFTHTNTDAWTIDWFWIS